MSTKASSKTSKKASAGFIPEKYRDAAAWAAILLFVVVFFADALFTGKNFLSEGDNVAFYSFIPYLDAAKESGEFPLWVPYIFSGMPSLASFLAAGERSWDFISMLLFAFPRLIGDLLGNDTGRLAMWYTIYGWGVYTLMRVKNHSRMVGVFSSVAAIFATFVIVWIMIGHSTKPVSLATLPWILLALERLREKFSLLNVFLLTLAMIALVSATHPQMMFYMGCAAGLYLITELVLRLIAKEGAVDVLKAGGALVVATVLALGTHADMFMSTREYTPHSTRGSAPLVQVEGTTQDQSGGNDYEYATNWSFSPEEVKTFFVPNFYGFGNLKVEQNGREQMTRLYWGQMPFTDAANYMGIGVLMLALLGAWYNRKDPFVIFLIVLGVFSLFLSMGKNLPILYDIFYNYAPAFNKFRAPSMALVLLQFAAPVLAGYGISTIVKWAGNKDYNKAASITLGAGAAFLVFGLLYTNVFESSYKNDVANALVAKNPGQLQSADQVSPQYTQMVFDEMSSDWTATGVLAVAFGLVVFLLVRGSIKPSMAIPLLILLTTIDLWRVDKRPYEPKEGSPEERVFRRTDAVNFLQQDKSTFRIVDVSRTVPSNWWAYHFIENLHGYSSAKIRLYQDMFDVAGQGAGREPAPGNSTVANPFMWNLLNAKYIVASQPIYQGVPPAFQSTTGALIYENKQVLPRAWFVNEVAVEADDRTMANMLRDGAFDPRSVAYVPKALTESVGAVSSTATATIASKGNQNISFTTNSPEQGFLVVSEIYYPEWQCTIDGKEVDVHRTNFLLRGVVVPAGKHTVEFNFVSPAFEQGRTISIASNIAALLIGLGGFGMWYRRRQGSETKQESDNA